MDGAVRSPARAFALADQLEKEIVAAGWPAGTLVGTEDQLLGRFGVGRGVMREAARLLEDHQVARMRRGRGGGLVVAEPDVRGVSEAVSIYLESIGVTAEDVFEARRVLDLFAVQLAADRLDEHHAALLRQALATDGGCGTAHGIEGALARATGNPVLAVFVETLSVLSDDQLAVSGCSAGQGARLTAAAAPQAHEAIVEAVIAGDGLLASQRMLEHLTAMQRQLGRVRATRTGTALSRGGPSANQLATRIRQDIARLGWPAGYVLGSETELLDRYAVGRATLREATRVLGQHGAVEMRRGPGGGLVVRKPDMPAVRRAAALHLRHLGMRAADLFEARDAIENATLQLAIERLDDHGQRHLRALPAAHAGSPPEAFGRAAHGFHILIAELGGNRTLELFVAILTGLTAEHLASQAAGRRNDRRDHRDAIIHAHRRIAEAVLSGDTALARRRMRLHLRALECWPE